MTDQRTGVLLVDDEPGDLHSAREALEPGGRFAIFSASTFEEAQEVFDAQGHAIGLAILDVSLPGRNGVDLAKHLLAAKPDLRVLFVSGHVGASVIRFYGIAASDDHFLQKPFDGQALVRRVEQILRSSTPLRAMLAAADGAAESL